MGPAAPQPGPRDSGDPPQPTRRWRALPAAAALLFCLLALDAARRETPTLDEFAHVAAGHALLEHGSSELYAKSPPLGRALISLPGRWALAPVVPPMRDKPYGWGPWQYGYRFMKANAERYFAIFTAARAIVVGFALLTAWLVFLWSRELFGERAAAIVTTLLLLSPTLLAHGHLATLDVASTATLLASVMALRWALRLESGETGSGLDLEGARRIALAGAAWGAALLVKFTALLLLPVYLVLIPLRRGRRGRRALAEIALLGVTALFVVNAGMGFRGSFSSLGAYPMASDFGQSVKSWLPAGTPVPLPWDWVRGFDAQKRDVEHAEFPSYLRGQWSRQGFPHYELVALLVKTPLPFLVMLAACPIALARRRPPGWELALLLTPIVVLFAMLTSLNQLNVGIRYLLPLFPFAYVLLGALFAGGGRLRTGLGALAVTWYLASALWVHPSHLAFFNLAAGGPSAGDRWLLDSNFDWGQDLYRLAPALDALGVDEPISLLYFGHVDPGLYGIEFRRASSEPEQALIAASVTYLKGFAYPSPAPGGIPARVGRNHLAWLADHEPILRLGSIWLFDTRNGGER